MSTAEVFFCHMPVCAVGCRHVMRVRRAAAQIVICFQLVCARVRWHICTHLHCYSLFSSEIKKCPESYSFLMVASAWLLEHGGACIEWTRLVNLQRSGSREFIVVRGVRQHRRNVIRGTSDTFLVRLRLRG